MPAAIGNSSVSLSESTRVVDLPIIKELTYFTSVSRTPFTLKTYIRRLLTTLLKAPVISSNRREAI